MTILADLKLLFLLGARYYMEKEMAAYSYYSLENPWTVKPGGLQSMEIQRAGHDWATFTRYYKSCYSRNVCATIMQRDSQVAQW